MKNLNFIKDEKGRIIKAVRGDYQATINWSKDDLDIGFCNFIITIVLTARGVGDKIG